MATKRKGLIAAAAAFAASPQGRRLLNQAKEYASRPETKARAQELLAQARNRRKGGGSPAAAPGRSSAGSSYGTPPS
jgi:hypothetical protein